MSHLSDEVLVELTLDGPAAYLVRRLHQSTTAIFAEEMAPYGVTAVQYAALFMVVGRPNLDQNTIGFLAGIERTTIVGVINRLVRKGLLKRTISKADRRARLLTPTRAGIRFIRQVHEPIDRISDRLLEACTHAEREVFCKIMRRLLRDRLRTEAGELTAEQSSSSRTAQSKRKGRSDRLNGPRERR
jgi:DNA-binding MarR family transcriptional regulator